MPNMTTQVDFEELMPEVVQELSDAAKLYWKYGVESWFDRLGDADRRRLVRLLQVRKRERAKRNQ